MLKKALVFVAFFLILGICCSASHAQTVNAASCNMSDVQNALNSVNQATAVVVIPSGTCSWSSGISYNVPSNVTSLTIQGATTVNCTGTPGTSGYACTASDTTVIDDAYPSNNSLITIAAAQGVDLRITGLTVQGGSVGSGSCGAPSGQSYCSKYAMVNVSGTHNLRMDHNHFNTTTYSPNSGINSAAVRAYAETEGVLDHNLVDMGNNTSVANGFQAFNTINDGIGYGDGTWANATAFGTSAFLFMEDNVFNGGAADDCNNAGRFVMRYNTINDAYVGVQNHSIKYYGGREQGCRAEEIYGNYFTGPSSSPANAAIGLNGGTAMIWGNQNAQGYFNFFASGVERSNSGQTEVATPTSWGYCGTAVNGNGVGSPWDGDSPSSTGWPCLDGLGRGQMLQAMNGQNFPAAANSSTGAITWPQQYLEPIYLFMNSLQYGNEGYFNDSGSTVWERDVYPDCGNTGSDCSGAFNGTKGTGYGPLASRPSGCTAGPDGTYGQSPTGSYGVGYWATDANSGTGELYVCTSTNTWTAVYEPYAYPHPLDGGTAPPTVNAPTSQTPQPPTGLSATVQ